jgi:hypothetical protein
MKNTGSKRFSHFLFAVLRSLEWLVELIAARDDAKIPVKQLWEGLLVPFERATVNDAMMYAHKCGTHGMDRERSSTW